MVLVTEKMAATSLQFGNLVTQLLVHTLFQVETLNKILYWVKRQEEQCNTEKEFHEVQIELSDAVRKVNAACESKPVLQQGMKVDLVEYFLMFVYCL